MLTPSPRRFLTILLAVGALYGLGQVPSTGIENAAQATVRPPPLALLLTGPGEHRSSLHYLRPGERLGLALAHLEHQASSTIRARTRPGDQAVFVTASVAPSGDYDTALFRVTAGRNTVRLCDHVVHASAPLVSTDGRVFIARGQAGPIPTDRRHYRVDALRIDRVDPSSGAVDTVHHFDGYLTHLAGFHAAGGTSGEIIVYRVGPLGADIVAVDAVTRSIRTVRAPILPFARDFSIDHDGRHLIYRGRHPKRTDRWTVESVDLRSGDHHTHADDPNFALAPAAWPGGGILINPGRRGPRLLDTQARFRAPWPRGVDILRAVDPTTRFIALLHTEQGHPPQAYVYDRTSQSAHQLPAINDRRVAIAGFVDPARGTLP